MSYLQLPDGIPAFSRAVISLWFRVPQSTIDAVRGGDILSDVIPLVTFGQPQVRKEYQFNVTDVAVWHYTPDEGTAPIMDFSGFSLDTEAATDPCCIGLFCPPGRGVAHLGFNLQMSDTAIVNSAVWVRTRLDIFHQDQVNPEPIQTGDGWERVGDFAYGRSTLADNSYIRNNQPELFYVEPSLQITADHWHHLLLSFDVGGSVSVGQPYGSSECRLWYAIDDVDYRGPSNLGPYRDAEDGLDDNAILTRTVYEVSGGAPGPKLVHNQYFPAPTGTLAGAMVPTGGAPLGLPASAQYVDKILPVEMAELQVFTGVTLDTADTTKRRAFIDAHGKPVAPEKAEELLSRKPDVLLHGSGHWIKGINTGGSVLGIPLTPTGKIISYSPDPSLNGPQGGAV